MQTNLRAPFGGVRAWFLAVHDRLMGPRDGFARRSSPRQRHHTTLRFGLATAAAVVTVGWSATAPAFASVTVTPDGDWPGYAGQYFNPGGSGDDAASEIGICYSQDSSESVSEVGWDEIASDGTVVSSWSSTALSGQPSDCVDTSISWTDLPEGADTYRVWARGTVSGVVYSDPWTVNVDRTAPAWPEMAADATADYDPDTSSVDLNWNFASDPDLADGTPGSDVSGYLYRYRRDGGAWSLWMDTPDTWVDLSSSHAGETIDLEIQAHDSVGNTGPTVSTTLQAEESSATPDNIGTAADDPYETGDPGELSDDDEPANMVDGNGDEAPPSETDDGEARASTDASSGYSETLCPNGGPCGTYDGNAAANYAINHYKIDSWLKRDKRWSYYGPDQGGDCTNFASESLYAGGMQFMGAEGHNSPDASDPADVTHFHFVPIGSWFSYFTQVLPGNLHYHPTASFVRSNDLFNHLIDYDLAEVVPHDGHVRRGDLVFQREGDGPYHHTQVVVRVAGSKIYVAQHSKPEYHSLDWLVKHHLNRPGHILNVDYFLVILHPTHTKADI